MTKEEDTNGIDDMQIDEPKGLNLDHLRVYYGKIKIFTYLSLLCLLVLKFESVFVS